MILPNQTGAMRLAYVQGGTILCFPSLNTILIKRILLSEPCTIIFRMCSGLSNGFTMTRVLNVLVFYFSLWDCDFFHCSTCAFDMCLCNYLLTYLLKDRRGWGDRRKRDGVSYSKISCKKEQEMSWLTSVARLCGYCATAYSETVFIDLSWYACLHIDVSRHLICPE